MAAKLEGDDPVRGVDRLDAGAADELLRHNESFVDMCLLNMLVSFMFKVLKVWLRSKMF